MTTELPPVATVARDILRLGVGGRLPTTMSYQELLGVGSGTVQRALREVRERGGVRLVSRGHQGTFVTAADTAGLWRLSELPPVHILLPMAGASESFAVAHALAEQFGAVGAACTVGFNAGAEARLNAVQASEADVAVMSAGAAYDLPAKTERVGVTLGPGTYYQDESLLVVRRKGSTESNRIGIDPASDDHQRLTVAEFPEQSAAYVDCDFTRLPRDILEGTVDVGVWHVVESLIPVELAGLETHPLSTSRARELARKISPAVLLGRADTVVGAMLSRVDVMAVRRGWEQAISMAPSDRVWHTRTALRVGTAV